jgi:hypothetical protein
MDTCNLCIETFLDFRLYEGCNRLIHRISFVIASFNNEMSCFKRIVLENVYVPAEFTQYLLISCCCRGKNSIFQSRYEDTPKKSEGGISHTLVWTMVAQNETTWGYVGIFLLQRCSVLHHSCPHRKLTELFFYNV